MWDLKWEEAEPLRLSWGGTALGVELVLMAGRGARPGSRGAVLGLVLLRRSPRGTGGLSLQQGCGGGGFVVLSSPGEVQGPATLKGRAGLVQKVRSCEERLLLAQVEQEQGPLKRPAGEASLGPDHIPCEGIELLSVTWPESLIPTAVGPAGRQPCTQPHGGADW